MGRIVRRYTLAEMESRLPSSPINVPYADSCSVYQNHKTGDTKESFGVKTVGDVIAVTEGKQSWNGVDRVLNDMAQIELPTCRSLRRCRKFAEDGDEVRVEAMLSGDIDHAMEGRKKDMAISTVPVYRILINGGHNCYVSADKFLWKAAAIIRFIEAVEAAGGSVEVTWYINVADLYKKGNDMYTLLCPIKQAGEDLSIRHMAVVCGLAGWFRVFGFAAMFHEESEVGYGLGHSVPEFPEELKENNDIVIGDVFSKEAAQNWLTEVVKKISDGHGEI